MRIGVDAKRALNNGTGLGNHARILLHALLRDFPENEYHLFSPQAKEAYFHQLHGDFKIHFPQSKFAQSFHPLWRSFAMVKDLLRERIDIYHGLSNEIPFGLPRSGIRSVVTIHDLIFQKHHEQYPWIDRQLYELKTRYAATHADRIIAVSRETKNDLLSCYGIAENKITVIYPSVDEAFQQPITATRLAEIKARYDLPRKFILNVGSFFPRKNQKTLIAAFARVKDKIDENLVLIGSGVLQREINSLIHTLGLPHRVHVRSDIRSQDLPAIYAGASLFVFPSLFEGFGAPVLEALFSKVPVIATKGGAIEEAAGSGALLVDPTSASELGDQMVRVLQDESLRAQMRVTGYAHAQTMTDKIFAEKTMEVYRSLRSI